MCGATTTTNLFILQVNSFHVALDKILAEIPIKEFNGFVSNKNKEHLIKKEVFNSKRECVRIRNVLARVLSYEM